MGRNHVGVLGSGGRPTNGATNTRRNFVRDKRPPRGRPCGGDCSSRADISRSMEHDCKRPAVAASTARDMLHDPATAAARAHTLSVQGLPGSIPTELDEVGTAATAAAKR